MAIAIAHAIENKLTLAYSNIINNYMSDGIIIIDKSGKITYINSIALNILELDGDLIGMDIKDVLKIPLNFDYVMDENIDFYNKRFTINKNSSSPMYELSVTNLSNNSESKGLAIILKKVTEKPKRIKYKSISQLYSFKDIIGESDAIKETIKLAQIASNGQSNVLIMGETGTGKELLAQSIHNNSPRRDKPFIAVNCEALPSSLVESELFGYEEGAFTGAKKGGQPGKFELANGGTIFLDEIGEMPLSIQASLLRVIEDRKIVRIGSSKEKDIDVLIIAATNKDLFEAVKNNTFRADLFYRINVFTLTIPPLRERKEDIKPLVYHFIEKYNSLFFRNVKSITKEALEILESYDWPGNVRELENTIERAIQITNNHMIDVKDLPIYIIQSVDKVKEEIVNKMSSLELKEYNAIQEILRATKGNIKLAAERLGISRATIYRKINRYGINLDKYRN
jgi:transcriptional regulator with PAS, ATPase and Fis domain